MAVRKLKRFFQETDGAIAVYGLFLFASIGMVVGLSMDVANAYKVRGEMQVAADVAGHTALLNRLKLGKQGAVEKAVAAANFNLAASGAQNAITATDIVYGKWNATTKVFTPDPTSTTAVMVTASRNKARSNGVNTFVLSLVGLKSWDVTTASVSETYRPTCLREGFVAENEIDIQSNNGFENGFCMHSNHSISINQNNYFEAGTIVSMPNLDNLEISASGFKQNDGLLEALRESFYKIRVVNRINDIITALQTGNASNLKTMTAGGVDTALDYITNTTPVIVNKCDITPADLTEGRMHKINCASTAKFSGNIKKVTIVTTAAVQFEKEAAFEDVILATTNTGDMSIKGPSGNGGGKKGSGLDNITFGKDDNCAAGGGVQLVTLGGVHMAAGLNMYGSQMLAAGEIEFTANADGIEGISMVSADTVSGTSNMQMGFCGTGMEDNFEVDYYRLAL